MCCLNSSRAVAPGDGGRTKDAVEDIDARSPPPIPPPSSLVELWQNEIKM